MAHEMIFAGSKHWCVLFVDMADSTAHSYRNGEPNKIRALYGTFINKLSDIAESFGGVTLNPPGDCVICYFPRTLDGDDKLSFKGVLDCGLAMIRARCEINSDLEKKGLPAISYRVCADYGMHEVVVDHHSRIINLISQTMNVCGKMKSYPNMFVIGSDLCENVKSFSEYSFKYAGECTVDPKKPIPLYSVLQKEVAISRMSPDNVGLEERAKKIDD